MPEHIACESKLCLVFSQARPERNDCVRIVRAGIHVDPCSFSLNCKIRDDCQSKPANSWGHSLAYKAPVTGTIKSLLVQLQNTEYMPPCLSDRVTWATTPSALRRQPLPVEPEKLKLCHLIKIPFSSCFSVIQLFHPSMQNEISLLDEKVG
ncbi:hypothetical protein CEXT_642291 [Caerostris extrusa]|uniref:Uncharacterized protein n=1 Tax=Caerostris extrusa TaxID=172846 RepID=A0AAV4Y8S3_CAEEX|nr:hypothetical protein CEXT_642291 [Caerostris extrusa]